MDVRLAVRVPRQRPGCVRGAVRAADPGDGIRRSAVPAGGSHGPHHHGRPGRSIHRGDVRLPRARGLRPARRRAGVHRRGRRPARQLGREQPLPVPGEPEEPAPLRRVEHDVPSQASSAGACGRGGRGGAGWDGARCCRPGRRPQDGEAEHERRQGELGSMGARRLLRLLTRPDSRWTPPVSPHPGVFRSRRGPPPRSRQVNPSWNRLGNPAIDGQRARRPLVRRPWRADDRPGQGLFLLQRTVAGTPSVCFASQSYCRFSRSS